jgi:hypothetical protein
MSEENRLYAVYLGGELGPGRIGEDHEVVFVVAPHVAAARERAKAKWRGHDKAHIDAVAEIEVVDGYAVRLEATEESKAPSIDNTYVAADD